ncbi:hypothetical protein TcCL_NonESM10658 [Trypanosoma cruzi]|nr:hypothetical protein TcCL_NonESM10658 [Trypanosoma cruzi]
MSSRIHLAYTVLPARLLKGGHPPAAIRRSHEECRQQACLSHPPSPSQSVELSLAEVVLFLLHASPSPGRRDTPTAATSSSLVASLLLHKSIIFRRVAHGSVSTIPHVKQIKLLLPETQSYQSKSEPSIQRLHWPNPKKLHQVHNDRIATATPQKNRVHCGD